jgi:hypothetical protein
MRFQEKKILVRTKIMPVEATKPCSILFVIVSYTNISPLNLQGDSDTSATIKAQAHGPETLFDYKNLNKHRSA